MFSPFSANSWTSLAGGFAVFWGVTFWKGYKHFFIGLLLQICKLTLLFVCYDCMCIFTKSSRFKCYARFCLTSVITTGKTRRGHQLTLMMVHEKWLPCAVFYLIIEVFLLGCCRFQISDLSIHQGMFTNDGKVICCKLARSRNGSKSYGNNHLQKLIDRNRDVNEGEHIF